MHHRRSAASIVAATFTTLVLLAGLAGCSSSSGNAASAGGPGTTATPTTIAAADVPAAPSSGCSATAVAPGDTQINLAAGTDAAWYLRHVPTAYSATTPMPLVLDFHGYSEGAKIHILQTELTAFGDTHGFITVTPQIERNPARWDTTLGDADLTFLGSVVDQAESTLCVDQNRVYVTGLSNGAFMTSAVACQFADRIAAAAPVAGIRDIDGCAPSRPVPVIAFHGTADPFVPYEGGLGPAAANLPAPDGSGRTLGEIGAVDPTAKGPDIPTITGDWAQRNGCGTTPTESTVTADVTLLTWPCLPGAEVELYRVTDGGHSWPGSKFSGSIANVVGKTTFTIDADELMWAFFEAHPLRPS
jgi:polyhydroxybutyrate depolymerase